MSTHTSPLPNLPRFSLPKFPDIPVPPAANTPFVGSVAYSATVTPDCDSFDIVTGNTVVNFFNRNITPYATSTLGPKFDLVPVERQKDLMINNARMYAQQEYDRIMELVAVLEKQAQAIKRRLDVTDAVHGAVYQFSPVMGNTYWLVWDRRKQHGGDRPHWHRERAAKPGHDTRRAEIGRAHV